MRQAKNAKKSYFVIECLKSLFQKKKSRDEGTNTANLLIKGKFWTCIVLSITSAFIDIVFFSGLSRSNYLFFTVPIAAGIILSIMSIGFSFGKFFVAIQLSAIREMQTRLHQMGYAWAKNFNKAKLKWNVVHKFLISISIITSISLSTITIGNGVRTMEMNIKNQSKDVEYLFSLRDKKESIQNSKMGTIDTTQQLADKAISGVMNADADAQNDIRLRQNAESEIIKISENESLTQDEKNTQITEVQNRFLKMTGYRSWATSSVDYIRKNYTAQATNTAGAASLQKEASKIIAESEEAMKAAQDEFVKSLDAKEYKLPDATPLKFTDGEGNALPIEVAISKLQASIMEWQVDTGDAGPSSKVFQLLATYINADPKAGGMGLSEIIMMVLICVFGIVQEYLIAIFTPKSIISRKMLSQFNEYMGEGFDPNRFMLETYKEYLDNGAMSSEAFEEKAKKCVRQMEYGVEQVIEKYKSKPKEVSKKPSDIEEKLAKLSRENETFMTQMNENSAELDRLNELVKVKNLKIKELEKTIQEMKNLKAQEPKVRQAKQKEWDNDLGNLIEEAKKLV